MFSVTQDVVPEDALLKTYRGGLRPESWRDSGDCFAVTVDRLTDLAEFVRQDYFASATHFKVANQRSCPRCMSVSSLLRRPAASFPTPASSVTTWHMAPRGSRYQE